MVIANNPFRYITTFSKIWKSQITAQKTTGSLPVISWNLAVLWVFSWNINQNHQFLCFWKFSNTRNQWVWEIKYPSNTAHNLECSINRASEARFFPQFDKVDPHGHLKEKNPLGGAPVPNSQKNLCGCDSIQCILGVESGPLGWPNRVAGGHDLPGQTDDHYLT
jgi:hypothetical protein